MIALPMPPMASAGVHILLSHEHSGLQRSLRQLCRDSGVVPRQGWKHTATVLGLSASLSSLLLRGRRGADTRTCNSRCVRRCQPTTLDGQGDKFEVRDLGDKGKGMVATQHIERGELLMLDEPLATWPGSLDDALDDVDAWNLQILDSVARCSPKGQAQFWALNDAHTEEGEPKTALGIILSNYHATGGGQEACVGVFPNAPRFNHSCVPNVVHTWRDHGLPGAEDSLAVRALVDIEPGEELCVSYLNLYMPRAERQEELTPRYGFQCGCPACSLTGDAFAASDKRRTELRELDRCLPMMADLDELSEMMGDLKVVVSKAAVLIDQELRGHAQMKCRLYKDAVQLAGLAEDESLTSEMARMAVESSKVAHGPESERTLQLQRCVENPRDCWKILFGGQSEGGDDL